MRKLRNIRKREHEHTTNGRHLSNRRRGNGEMSVHRQVVLGLCAAIIGTAAAAPARQVNYGGLPLGFEPNRGQAEPQTEYVAHGAGYSVSLLRKGILLNLRAGAGRKD